MRAVPICFRFERQAVERAFSRAVRRELSRALFPLDAALGFSSAAFVLEWFRAAKAHAGRGGLSKLSA